jgi:cell division protein FtsB
MKKVLYLLIIIASLYIMNNLVRSIYNLWQKKDLITQAQTELVKQQNENEKLQDQLKQVKRKDFIEEQARDKLFMVREGEKVVILPQTQGEQAGQGTPVQTKPRQPIWQQWIALFSPQQ